MKQTRVQREQAEAFFYKPMPIIYLRESSIRLRNH